jgi:hypothetical protein
VSSAPDRPKIYHITHVGNLAAISAAGGLVSDRAILARAGPSAAIGMSQIKRRRLEVLRIPCCGGDFVGDYVPFYFCPRSIMLFVIHCANHPELEYRGGQGPIVHLEADLREVVRWAEANRRKWAFSLSNAGATYTEFRATLDKLDEVDWSAIDARDFRDPDVKEGKQAEFLVHGEFPLSLVRRVGVYSDDVKARAEAALSPSGLSPVVEVRRGWYY